MRQNMDDEECHSDIVGKYAVSGFNKRLFKLGYFLSNKTNKVSMEYGYFIIIFELLQITSLCFNSKVLTHYTL